MMLLSRRLFAFAAPLAMLASSAPVPLWGQENTTDKYTQDEILTATKDFFGDTSKDLATIIEKVFKDQGQPNAYISGEEAAGAIAIGVRYGNGWMHRKNAKNMRVYWQGLSLGFDLGANASKVLTLVYNIGDSGQILRKPPRCVPPPGNPLIMTWPNSVSRCGAAAPALCLGTTHADIVGSGLDVARGTSLPGRQKTRQHLKAVRPSP